MGLRAGHHQMEAAVREHGNTLKAEFQGIVSDWEHQPDFVVETKVTASAIAVEVRPRKRRKASDIFGWVDKGTKPHVIRPKRSNKRGRLAFRLGYSALTRPIARAHVGTGQANGPFVMPAEVHHPGTTPRRFSETVQQRTYPAFRKLIESTFRRMARQKG